MANSVCKGCGAVTNEGVEWCPECMARAAAAAREQQPQQPQQPVQPPPPVQGNYPPQGYYPQAYQPVIAPEQLPPQYRPLRPWAYVGYSILFSLPIVGLIMMIIYAVNDDNINRRNYARSYLWMMLIMVAVWIIVAIIAASAGALSSISYYNFK